MWLPDGELDVDCFSDDVQSALFAAGEKAMEKKSRKLSCIELLWAMLFLDPDSERCGNISADGKKHISDVRRIMGKNLEPGIDERAALQNLSDMILERDAKSPVIGYFMPKNMDSTLLDVFSELERIGGESGKFLEIETPLDLKSFRLVRFAYVVFNRLRQNSSSEISMVMNVVSIAGMLMRTILAGEKPRDPFGYEGDRLGEMLFDKSALGILRSAAGLAGEKGSREIKPVDLFHAFAADGKSFGGRAIMLRLPEGQSFRTFQEILKNLFGSAPDEQKTMLMLRRCDFSEKARVVLVEALRKAGEEGRDAASEKHLFLSLMEIRESVLDHVLTVSLQLEYSGLIDVARQLEEGGVSTPKLPTDIFPCSDLTMAAREGGTGRIVDRPREAGDIERILFRKRGRNIILYGEPGIGKTAMSGVIANRIVRSPMHFLKGFEVIYINLGGVTINEIKAGSAGLFDYMEQRHQTLYFIDGFHKLYRACPELCAVKLRENEYYFIGTIEGGEYPEMSRELAYAGSPFEFYRLDQPSEADTVTILDGYSAELGTEYRVEFENGLAPWLVKMASSYLLSEKRPAGAARLLELAYSSEAYENGDGRKTVKVTKRLVAGQVAEKTGFDVDRILCGGGEPDDYTGILGGCVFGQDAAVRKTADRLGIIKAGLADRRLPRAVFVFAGLSGTGKSELASGIARIYSQAKKPVVFSMEGFSGGDGAECGGTGRLVEALLGDPYSVVVLDDIEKAAPDAWAPFMALFDGNPAIDRRGRAAFGDRAMFILMTRMGAEKTCAMMREGKPAEEIEAELMNELAHAACKGSDLFCLRSELIGRIARLGGIVPFGALSLKAMEEIAGKLIGKLCDEWRASHGGELLVDGKVTEHIAHSCYLENETRIGKPALKGQAAAAPNSYLGGCMLYGPVERLIASKLGRRIRELDKAPAVTVAMNGNDTVITADGEEQIAQYVAQRRAALSDGMLKAAEALQGCAGKLYSFSMEELAGLESKLGGIISILGKG